ncbi:MAG: VOC family protein [Chloroflexi bacterium]|nr:MAG: VOC family protein [Chloroflexota bacterium]TMD51976.1 MAG: VOC family protein [Chloroflexota bacterium]
MFSGQATFAMYVPDIREALAFYTDKLGFREIDDQSESEFPYATAALPDASWRFVFVKPDLHGEELRERFQAEIGFAPHFLLTTDDLNAEVKRLADKGVEVTSYPKLDANGMIQAHFKDHLGNEITLIATESLF